MFGVTSAVIVFAVFFAAHLVFSHLCDANKKERVLVLYMAAASITYVVVLLATPPTAFAGLRIVSRCENGIAGFAALGFLVLGYAEFWSLVERSFSLRIIVDVAASESGLTRGEIAKHYSEDLGLDWMMQKRIEDLVGTRMVVPNEMGHQLSPRGRLVAHAFRLLRSVLAIK
jgi:hypothetical protein